MEAGLLLPSLSPLSPWSLPLLLLSSPYLFVGAAAAAEEEAGLSSFPVSLLLSSPYLPDPEPEPEDPVGAGAAEETGLSPFPASFSSSPYFPDPDPEDPVGAAAAEEAGLLLPLSSPYFPDREPDPEPEPYFPSSEFGVLSLSRSFLELSV